MLSYLPDWAHGEVGQHRGRQQRRRRESPPGVAEHPLGRTQSTDRKFLLTLYSRKTTSVGPAGPLLAFEVLQDWTERTSGPAYPTTPRLSARYKFEPGEGWKVFDVTPIIRSRNGILLRFLSEDRPGREAGLVRLRIR